jgi:MFS family permease
MLLWAPNSAFLIAAGALQGFFHINAVVTAAMAFELVPHDRMGRWMGMVRLFRMIPAAGSAYLAGFLWDHLGPHTVFLFFLGLDLFVRMPLIFGMPETLRKRGRLIP